MTTKIWRVEFHNGFERFDILAKTASAATRLAIRMFKTDTLNRGKGYLNARIKSTRQLWRSYVNDGYTQVTSVELIAESDN